MSELIRVRLQWTCTPVGRRSPRVRLISGSAGQRVVRPHRAAAEECDSSAWGPPATRRQPPGAEARGADKPGSTPAVNGDQSSRAPPPADRAQRHARGNQLRVSHQPPMAGSEAHDLAREACQGEFGDFARWASFYPNP